MILVRIKEKLFVLPTLIKHLVRAEQAWDSKKSDHEIKA